MTLDQSRDSRAAVPVRWEKFFPLTIAAVWFLLRLFPWSQMHIWTYWEVQEAKKILEYGFWERHGAFINVHFMTGLLERPESFNYVNHPVLLFWMDTLLYWIFGGAGIIVASAAFGLAGALITYRILARSYSPNTALFVTLLLAAAPVSILYDVDPCITSVSAISWPLLILVVQRAINGEGQSLILAGATAFLACASAWIVWPLLGAIGITLMLFPPNRKKRDWPLIAALVAGGALGVIAFLVQIYSHVPDLQEMLRYVGKQSVESSRSMAATFFGIAIRGLLSAGVALLLGGLIRIIQLARQWPSEKPDFLESAMLVYIIIFGAMTIVLRGYMWSEEHPYEYLLFPCAVLTSAALFHTSSRFFRWTLAALAICGALYPQIQATIPRVTQRSMALAKYLRDSTEANQLILTNIQNMKAPMLAWDVGALNSVSIASDRMICWGTDSSEEVRKREHQLSGHLKSVVFLLSDDLPVDPELQNLLAQSKPEIVTISTPADCPGLAFELRRIYWKMTGRFSLGTKREGENATRTIELKRYTWALD